jgi:DNA-binding transcriptional MocR family regulator
MTKIARRRHQTSYSGQFAGRLTEMLESPAYRVLSLSAHRVLSRIEVEFGHHGGRDNGKLPVTFEQFEDYGIDRHSIAPAIRELEALGFIQVTERGCAGNAAYRRPNRFRLTYRDAEGVISDGSHEWRLIKSIDEAKALQRAARATPTENQTRRGGRRVRGLTLPPIGTANPVGKHA